MFYSLSLTQAAKLDVQEAWLWYEEKQSGLGDDFISSLDSTISIIIQNPFLFEVKFEGLRVAPTKRFPFRVIYYLEDTQIGVIAVFHTSRNPTVWKERTDD